MMSPTLFALLHTTRGLLLPALAMLLSATAARADDLDTCVEASESGQKLRDDGQYLKARTRLRVCAREVCPIAVKKDCLEELARMDAAIPTVVFGVTGVPSAQIGDVLVTVQGHEGPYRIDGKPVMFDPGVVKVRFEFKAASVEKTVVLKAGTKHRAVEASFEIPDRPVRAPTAPAPAPERPVETGPPWLGYSLLGAGTIAVGGMAWMWVRGRGELRDLRQGCGATQTCDQDDVDGARNMILLGDILGGVGVATLGLGSYLLLTGTSQPDERALRTDAVVSERGAALSLSGAF